MHTHGDPSRNKPYTRGQRRITVYWHILCPGICKVSVGLIRKGCCCLVVLRNLFDGAQLQNFTLSLFLGHF